MTQLVLSSFSGSSPLTLPSTHLERSLRSSSPAQHKVPRAFFKNRLKSKWTQSSLIRFLKSRSWEIPLQCYKRTFTVQEQFRAGKQRENIYLSSSDSLGQFCRHVSLYLLTFLFPFLLPALRGPTDIIISTVIWTKYVMWNWRQIGVY